VANLRARRQEISNQIINVRDRRNEIAKRYEVATGANRSGLEQQLRILDQRLAQLEVDLAESGRVLTSSPVLTTSTGVPDPQVLFNLGSGQVTGISIVFILFVLCPIAASFGRMLWRKSTRAVMPPGWYDASQRLEHLEQAVDTIAVEIERVSEGQRYMTKLMTQGDASQPNAGSNASVAPGLNAAQPLPALGAGSPEPIVLQNQRDEVRVRRG
jgi:hypothetical protein